MTATDAKPPLRIGLTGGIASGKSTVADIFAELGVPVIDTDVIAREVVQPGEPAINEIRERFGDAVIDTKDHLDRAAMRKIIFADETARLDLEAILHPRIGEQVRRQADAACGPYQLIVVPLLIGSPIREYVDRILVVDCDEKTQIQRLLKRDSESIEQAQKILDSQPSRQERLAIADDVIINDQELEQIQSQVIALHQHYQRLAEH